MIKLNVINDCNVKILSDLAQLTLDKAIEDYTAGVMSETPFAQLYCALDELEAQFKADIAKAKRKHGLKRAHKAKTKAKG
jgi:hypothetical protein